MGVPRVVQGGWYRGCRVVGAREVEVGTRVVGSQVRSSTT